MRSRPDGGPRKASGKYDIADFVVKDLKKHIEHDIAIVSKR